MIDESLIIDLFEASDALVRGDTSGIARLLPYIKSHESYCEIPVLFYVTDNIETLEFLERNSVDFFQKNNLGGGNLLHRVALECDEHIFEWVLVWYKNNNIIDEPDENGISALSMLLKFGRPERAKRMIDSGASLSTVANNGLTPARQAVFCIEGEQTAIECLEIVITNGPPLSNEEFEYLAQAARLISRQNLATRIEKNRGLSPTTT